MLVELRGDPTYYKSQLSDSLNILYWVGAKESLWKPSGIYRITNLLCDPTNPKLYRVAQFVHAILMDVFSAIPVAIMLYWAGYLDLAQAMIIPLIYLTLPHLNSVEIRFESFGQRTVGPVIFQFFLMSLWLISSTSGLKTEILTLLVWFLFIYVSYRTSLFGFQLAIFSSVIFSLLSMTVVSLLGLLCFVIYLYFIHPVEFKNFLNERILHTRAQWTSRRSSSGYLCGSSALIDALYRKLRGGFEGLLSTTFISLLTGSGATISLRHKLSNFLKRVVLNKNDELIRMLISNSVFIIPLLLMYLLALPTGISEGGLAAVATDLRGIWGDAVTGIYTSIIVITALVLFVPKLVAFGEASRYLNHCLPQTLVIFLVIGDINYSDEATQLALTGLIFLSVVLSLLKFLFFEQKVAMRSFLETMENIKVIFRKPPGHLFFPELHSLESFIQRMRNVDRGEELKLMILPLKNNSSFLIANYIIAKRSGVPTNIKVYSMWRDSSIFKSDSHYHGNIYLPMPSSFDPLRYADIVVVQRPYKLLYQDWLLENGYHDMHMDAYYSYHCKLFTHP